MIDQSSFLIDPLTILNKAKTWLLACCVSLPVLSTAQTVNPYESDPSAIRAGQAIFGAQCATCHGGDAKGLDVAPDLTLLWAVGADDGRIFETIRDGVPGSIMPANAMTDTATWGVVAYLKSISTVPEFAVSTGNVQAGEQYFSANCARCHRVQGDGGSLGPDLSRIAAVRSKDALIQSIRDPSASIGRRYKPISLLTADGQHISGTIKSEDAFSLQIMDSNQRLMGFNKKSLQQLTVETTSLMPGFSSEQLDDKGLDDLLAYLSTLR